MAFILSIWHLKIISIPNCINKIKKKKLLIISVDAEKHLRISVSIHYRISHYIRKRGRTSLAFSKDIYEKRTANIIMMKDLMLSPYGW